MGFSPLGAVVSLLVLAPNLLLIRFPPVEGFPQASVPAPLAWIERAGQALCLVVPAVTEPRGLAWWWVAPTAVFLALYYGLWGRYLAGGRRAGALYAPLWRVPVPMALFPVLAFLSAAAWLSNWWIAVAALVLAAGHIPSAAIIARSVVPRR